MNGFCKNWKWLVFLLLKSQYTQCERGYYLAVHYHLNSTEHVNCTTNLCSMSLVGVEALGGLNSFSVGISLVVSVASKSMEILFRAPIFF